jgi:Tol biopolymer transport system component
MPAIVSCAVLGCAGDDGVDTNVEGSGRLVEPDPIATLIANYPIVFGSDRDVEGVQDLYLMALDGGVQRVTRTGGLFLPRWSPGGDGIAFRQQVENATAEIGLVAPDGGVQVLLSSGEDAVLWDFPPNWVPDGSGIAYGSRREPETTWIWVMPREGGVPAPLFPGDAASRVELAWSPADPTRIAFADYDRAAATHGDGISQNLWVAPASDVSAAVNLTEGRVHAPRSLRWSPDGTRIAFQAFTFSAPGIVEGTDEHSEEGPYTPPDEEILVVDVESHALTRLTDNTAHDGEVTWSPDGQSLIIMSDRDGDPDLWLVPVDAPDQARNLIDDLDNPREDVAPDWFWIAP